MAKVGLTTMERVPVASLSPHPNNPRQGDVGAICQSLKSHGQYRPIVVHGSTRHILAGNHTWKAAVALGWSEIDAVIIDCDDDQAQRILLVDNRSGDIASYDDNALADLLTELVQTPLGLDGTGFDGDALDELLADLNRVEDVQGDAAPSLGDTEYQLVVTCSGEHDQAQLCVELEGRGYACRPLML